MPDYYDIPFVPSSLDRLDTMIKLADINPPCFSLDLGSGDGQVVIAMARQGALAHGVEIDPGRFALTCENLALAGLEGKAFVCHSSIWETDFHPFDIVTVYGITSMMHRLEIKLKQELKPGAKFISNGFLLPHWDPILTENNVHLYLR